MIYGSNGTLTIDCTEDIDHTIEQIETYEPGTIVSSFGRGIDDLSTEEKKRYFRCLNDQSKSGRSVLHLTRQWPDDPLRANWDSTKADEKFEWYHTCGDLSFVCNDPKLAHLVEEWVKDMTGTCRL